MSLARIALKNSSEEFSLRPLRRSALPPDTIQLPRGPGRRAAAFQIDRRHDGVDLRAPGPLWLGEISHPTGQIGKTVRIGITRAADQLLRFYERGNPFVSGPQRLLLPHATRKKAALS